MALYQSCIRMHHQEEPMPLIAFEGIDGAGKSTQIALLSSWLQARGHETLVTCEPTHHGHGKRIREANPRLSPLEERNAFVLDRREHVETCILPALRQNKIVLCDRYYYSSMAYQGTRLAMEAAIQEDEAIDAIFEDIRHENEAFAPAADLLLLFDMSVDEALRRIRNNRDNADSFETRDNLLRVKASFSRVERLIRQTGQTRIATIHVDGTIDEVSRQIQNAVLEASSQLGVVI